MLLTSHLNEANPNHAFETATQVWPIMHNRKTQRLPPPMGTPKLQPFTEKLLMEKNHKTNSKDLQPPQDPTPSTSSRQPPYKAGPGNQPSRVSSTPARLPTVGSLLQQKDPCSPHGVHPIKYSSGDERKVHHWDTEDIYKRPLLQGQEI